MITLYGGPRNRGGRCILALQECGLDYELRNLDLDKDEHKSADYLALNPNGKVPCLVDGEQVLWESMAINLYLADKYGDGLLPARAETRGEVLQWTFWTISTLEPPLITLVQNKVTLPEEERDPAAATAATKQLKEVLAILDRALAGQDYLVGPDFTIADLNVASTVAWGQLLGVDMSDLAELMRWLAAVQSRPSFTALMQH